MPLTFEETIITPAPDNPCYSHLDLSGVKIASQNVNSLGLGSSKINGKNDNFLIKINSILKLGNQIIMLQDIRVSNNLKTLKDYLAISKFGKFDSYINSSKNERGVGILI